MYRKTIKNIVSIASSDVLTRGIFVLFNVVVARTIDMQEFAIFSLAVTLSIYFWAVVDGGITGHSIKLVAKSNKNNWAGIIGVATATRLGLAITFSIVVTLVLLVLPISTYEGSVYFFSLLYVIAASIFLAWFSRGIQDNVGYLFSYAIISIILVFSLTGFFVAGMFSSQNALSAIIWRNISWLIGAAFVFFLILKRNQVIIHLSDFKFSLFTLKQTYPLGIAAILYSFIPVFPQLMLRFFNLKDELALYASAWTVQQVLLAGASILSSSFLPMLSRYVDSKDDFFRLLKTHFSLVILTGLTVSFIWYSIGGSIIQVLFGSNYDFASVVLPLFSMVVMVVFLRTSIDAVLIVFGQYKNMMVNGIIAVLFMFILVSMIEDKGIIAMGKVYLFGEVVLLLSNLYVLRKLSINKSYF